MELEHIPHVDSIPWILAPKTHPTISTGMHQSVGLKYAGLQSALNLTLPAHNPQYREKFLW